MAAGTQSHHTQESESESHRPDIAVCESCPGRVVFTEADNTEGWIASDLTVDVFR
jgi:hypothetical protein